MLSAKTRATQQRAPMLRPEENAPGKTTTTRRSSSMPREPCFGTRHVAPDDRTHGAVTEDFFAECSAKMSREIFPVPSFSSPSAPLGKEGAGKAPGEAFVDSPRQKSTRRRIVTEVNFAEWLPPSAALAKHSPRWIRTVAEFFDHRAAFHFPVEGVGEADCRKEITDGVCTNLHLLC